MSPQFLWFLPYQKLFQRCVKTSAIADDVGFGDVGVVFLQFQGEDLTYEELMKLKYELTMEKEEQHEEVLLSLCLFFFNQVCKQVLTRMIQTMNTALKFPKE